MGEPERDAARAIRRAIDDANRASDELERCPDPEAAASVETAVAAARFSLTEALRRLGR